MENRLEIGVSRAGRNDEVTLLVLDGRLHMGTYKILENAFDKLLAQGDSYKFVLDLSGVPFLSSAGMRALLAANKSAASKGGGLKLAALRPEIGSLLAMTGLNTMFEVYETVDEAIASF